MKTMRQLDKENRKNLALLPVEMQKELKTMLKYLRQSRINGYDSALIGSDLIAMGLDAAQREQGLDDVIGSGRDREEFCRQLVENARPKSVMESVMFWLRILLLWASFSFMLELGTYSGKHLSGTGLSHMLEVTPRHLVLVFGMCLLDCGGRYYYRFAYKSDRFQVLYTAGIFLAYGIVGTGVARLFPYDIGLFQIPFEPAGLMALGLWLAAELLYRLAVRPRGEGAGARQ